MMGRKLEEGDWSGVYCAAKGLPEQKWSNLLPHVIHDGLVVEHKMVCYRSKPSLLEACGTTIMHPAATRSIRVPPPDTDPDQAMREVLKQYAGLVEERCALAIQTRPDRPPDVRIGWLLWQESLREFLYFEEEMLKPRVSDYRAEWVTRESGRRRKGSTNLWVYERASGRKRYSVTTEAGAKIQPYFDVPSPDHPSLYLFRVQGEELPGGLVRVWATDATAEELGRLLGGTSPDELGAAVRQIATLLETGDASHLAPNALARPLLLRLTDYDALRGIAPDSVSDEHMLQSLVRHLRDQPT